MPTILVVEADRLLRSAITAYLRRQGYSVLEAAEAISALECLGGQSVQAVVVDTHPLQGIELLRGMRSQPAFAQTPVVAIVANNPIEEILDYLEPGDYLRIPFDMPFLDWILKKLLAQATGLETDSAKVGLPAFHSRGPR